MDWVKTITTNLIQSVAGSLPATGCFIMHAIHISLIELGETFAISVWERPRIKSARKFQHGPLRNQARPADASRTGLFEPGISLKLLNYWRRVP